jgi:hypothetical protein
VNRHEWHPETGRSLDEAIMRADVLLMKQAPRTWSGTAGLPHLDAAHHGIGSASCGPRLPPEHTLVAHTIAWTLGFSPGVSGVSLSSTAGAATARMKVNHVTRPAVAC